MCIVYPFFLVVENERFPGKDSRDGTIVEEGFLGYLVVIEEESMRSSDKY